MLRVTLALAGDYNQNGVVDAADYTVWRDTFNAVDDLRADGNRNGVIDAADYNVWRDNFGNAVGVNVPESTSALLLVVGTFGLAWMVRRRR